MAKTIKDSGTKETVKAPTSAPASLPPLSGYEVKNIGNVVGTFQNEKGDWIDVAPGKSVASPVEPRRKSKGIVVTKVFSDTDHPATTVVPQENPVIVTPPAPSTDEGLTF